MKRWGRHNRISLDDAKTRFIGKTKRHKSGCLNWTGAKGSHGRYGSAGCFGRSWLAHRLSYTLFVGPIPMGMEVCHRCDNGLCVEPSHLFIGTQGDNIRDMEDKRRSRHPFGENHGRAKLTVANVAAIRRLANNGASGRSIARTYGVNKSTIYRILHGRGWNHQTLSGGPKSPRKS